MTFKVTSQHLLKRTILSAIAMAYGTSSWHQIALADDSTMELDTINVISERISDTHPVKGYNAKQSTTATRTDTPLRDVPQSITVITQDVMQDMSMQSIADAVQYVPGVQAAQGEGNRDALIFRGNATTSDLYVDGLRDDIQTYRDFYNTDRVEVLKGPNGMIFGRGGAGGVVNRVTKEAGWDPVRELRVSYGAFEHRRISADIGDSLNSEVAFRVNTVYENSDSYRDGVNLERYGINPTFTFLPGDKSKITVGLEYFKDKRIADRGVPSVTSNGDNIKNRPYDLGDYDQFFGNAQQSPTETETVAFNAMFEHQFDNGLKLKNRTRYANYNKFYQNTYADSPINNGVLRLSAYRDETDRENLLNQTDLIYTLSTGSIEHKLLAGAEFNVQDTDNKRFTGTSVNNIPVSQPTAFIPLNTTPARNQEADVTIAGYYLQDQITFNQYWQAIVGVRYDNIDIDYRNLAGNDTINTSDNLLSPRAGLIFKPVEAVSLYANYSISYVPRAGDQLLDLRVVPETLKPEKFINKEIGAKWDILPNLAFTLALYELQRENMQIADPNNAGQALIVDGQETQGLELGIAGNITDQWSVFGGLTLQDGEITKAQGSGNSAIAKGADLAMTPDRTLSLWNKYQINDMWAVALGVISTSERYAATPTATTSTIMPGYTRYDAAVFAKFSKQLSLQVNIENLTNKEYALFAHNNNNITPGSPLTGRATLIYNF